jgi:hypothetical protein
LAALAIAQACLQMYFGVLKSVVSHPPLLFAPFIILFGLEFFYIDSTCFSRFEFLAPEFIQG